MRKYIDAEKLKARIVKTVVTIDPTLEDTAQAWQKGYNIALMNVAGGLDEMTAADVVDAGNIDHEMAVILADLFGCPLDYDIGEDLCEVCDFVKGVLPCTNDDVACWEQYLKHRERGKRGQGIMIKGYTDEDLISRLQAAEARVTKVSKEGADGYLETMQAESIIKAIPRAHTEGCEGCKHLRKFENEVEYGYLSPCTVCKRKARDYYER